MNFTKLIKGIGVALMLVCLSPAVGHGQFLKDVGRLAKNKLKRKVENKATEILAEEIARRAFRPINDVMDDWVRENMKRDSSYAGLSDDSLAVIMAGNYAQILNNLNRAADLPPSYEFEYIMDVEVTDDKESHEMTWFIDQEGEAMAFEQMDGKEKRIMLLDIKNDIIVMYDPKNKTGQALPGMMSAGAAFAQTAMEEQDMEMNQGVKQGGNKMVAGYNCTSYLYDSEEYESEVWVSTEVPFTWKNAFGTLIGRVSPKLTKQQEEAMDAMMLESTTKEKGKKKGKYKSISKWETKSINEKVFSIDNKAYEFGMEME